MPTNNFEKKPALTKREIEAMSDEKIVETFEQESIAFFCSNIPWQTETHSRNLALLRQVLMKGLRGREKNSSLLTDIDTSSRVDIDTWEQALK